MPSIDRMTCRTCCRQHNDRKTLWSHLTKKRKHKRPRHASSIKREVNEQPETTLNMDPLSSLPCDPTQGLLIKGLAGDRQSEQPEPRGISMSIPYHRPPPHNPLPRYDSKQGLSILGCANCGHVEDSQPRYFGFPGGPNPNDVEEIRPKQETPDKENWPPQYHQSFEPQDDRADREMHFTSTTTFIGRYPVGAPF